MQKPRNPATILITNDDGIYSEGIKSLAESLSFLGTIWIVAPKHEQSAVGHSLTLHRPLRAKKLEKESWQLTALPRIASV